MSAVIDQDNLARLDGCAGPHDFQLLASRGETGTRIRYRCGRCGGEVNSHAHGWYTRGLLHGLRHAESHYTKAAAAALARSDGADAP